MRPISVLALFFLVGCTASPTLEELKDTAIVSGDWSEVEKRERSLQRRLTGVAPVCPQGYTRVCIENGSQENCSCLRPTGQ
ncbi:MAG: hypothetical protein IID58_03585 [Proteobacteria bacterium]|nr:hypothetical protein [Pseudomonadota bacterium]